MCVSTSPIIVLMELPGCAAGCAIGDDGFPQWPGADVDMLARGLQEQAQAAIQAPPEEDAESGEEGDPEEEEEQQQHDSDDDRAAGEDQPHVLPDYCITWPSHELTTWKLHTVCRVAYY